MSLKMLASRQLRFSYNLLHVPQRNCTATNVKKPPSKLFSRKLFLQIVDQYSRTGKRTSKDVQQLLALSVHNVVNQNDDGRVELIQHVWKEAERNGFTFRVDLYNEVLKHLVFCRLPFEPVDFVKSMEGIQPDEYTYQLLIKAHAHRGEPEVIRKLMEYDGSEAISQQSHGWLMHAYIRNGDADSADNVEENLRIEPTIDLYDPVISVHAELGSVSGIQYTFRKMAASGIPPTIAMYLNMLESLAIGNHPKLIKNALYNMENLADVADHFEPLIRRCVIRGHYNTATTLLRCVKRDRERLQMYEDHIKEHKAFFKSKF